MDYGTISVTTCRYHTEVLMSYKSLLENFTKTVSDPNWEDFSVFVYSSQDEKIIDLQNRVKELEFMLEQAKKKRKTGDAE